MERVHRGLVSQNGWKSNQGVGRVVEKEGEEARQVVVSGGGVLNQRERIKKREMSDEKLREE